MSSIVDSGKYNTIINVLSGSYVAWGVANENRETFRYSDDFVIQDGDACVDIMVASNLGKDRFEYIVFLEMKN